MLVFNVNIDSGVTFITTFHMGIRRVGCFTVPHIVRKKTLQLFASRFLIEFILKIEVIFVLYRNLIENDCN